MEQRPAVVSNKSREADAGGRVPGLAQEQAIERLPFTIKRVRTDEDMWKAVQIRHAAYARHLPEFAQTLRTPEDEDYEEDAVLLLAESKLDGSALGSTRIQTNLHERLSVEYSVELPSWLQGRRLAEVSRLGIGEGRIGRVVKVALIKACFEYCEHQGIDHAVVTGRAPIDRQYEQLLFTDVFADKEPVPLRHVGNIPHRVMSFEIATGQQRWEAAAHPLLDFFRYIRHPDIDIGNKRSVPLAHAHPALATARQPPNRVAELLMA
jgi:hypothetical protein